MKILLINPQMRIKPEFFPIGLGHIASVLSDAGHKLDVLDFNAFRLSKDETEEKVRNLKYDAVAISGAITTAYNYIKWLTSIIKQNNPNIPIIAGGIFITPTPELILKNTKIDIGVIGEGEITAPELFNTLENHRNLSKVKGICFKKENKIIKNRPRPLIEDLDTIPFPKYDLFPTEVYLKNPIGITRAVNKMGIISSRGCPYNCTFCYKSFGQTIRYRSPENVIEEVKFLKEKYKIKNLFFLDENFIVNKKWVYNLCNKIEKLNLNWICEGRADLINLDLLKRMKKAGCINMCYGIESGSQKILNNINKQITVQQSLDAIKLTRQAGIIPQANFMMGNIGETKKTICETINFCKEADLNTYKSCFSTAFPGTILYKQAQKLGKIKDEEKYLLALEDTSNTLLINFTDMSDEELIKLKYWAENVIIRNYNNKHKLEAIKYKIDVLWTYYKLNGFKRLIQRGVEKIIQKQRYDIKINHNF